MRVASYVRKPFLNNSMKEQTASGRSTMLFSSARSRLTSQVPPCYALLLRSTRGLLFCGEAVWDKPAQYISMRSLEMTWVIPNRESS